MGSGEWFQHDSAHYMYCALYFYYYYVSSTSDHEGWGPLSQRICLRILSITLEDILKALDFVEWLNYNYFVFLLFLSFCIFSLLWLNLLFGTWGRPGRLKFSYRQEAAGGHGRESVPWRLPQFCSVTTGPAPRTSGQHPKEKPLVPPVFKYLPCAHILTYIIIFNSHYSWRLTPLFQTRVRYPKLRETKSELRNLRVRQL